MASSTSTTSIEGIITDKQVVVHPLVLLSIVDHYNRVAKGTSKRVVGTLIGEMSAGNIHVTNSFAVPFEEDPRDPTVWFLDHNYHESLFAMFKKVNAKERVVGWYSTGPKIKPADLEIHEVYRRYCAQPVYAIIDVQPKEDQSLPIDAYFSMEEPKSDRLFKRTFVHIPSTVGAYEAEEVGVEHLLRDIKNASTSTLATKVGDKLGSLKGLIGKLQEMALYLSDVAAGKLPPNAKILYNLQDLFNLLPDADNSELVKSFSVETNDMMLAMYLGSVVRSVIALHNLINNKLENKRKIEAKIKEVEDMKEEEEKKKDKERKEEEDKKKKEAEREEDERKRQEMASQGLGAQRKKK